MQATNRRATVDIGRHGARAVYLALHLSFSGIVTTSPQRLAIMVHWPPQRAADSRDVQYPGVVFKNLGFRFFLQKTLKT